MGRIGKGGEKAKKRIKPQSYRRYVQNSGEAVFTVIFHHFMFFPPGDMWYQITAGKGSAYLTEQGEDAHHSRDAYEA